MTDPKSIQPIHVKTDDPQLQGSVEWRSPSNIALTKYWGKKGIQIPMNPSLSMTLKYAFTQTEVKWEPKGADSTSTFDFFLSGEKVGVVFEKRVELLIDQIAQEYPVLNDLHFTINSINTFPHSTGIASSASGLSALALSMLTVAQLASGKTDSYDDFLQKAAHYARLGSGSASRSVYGPYAIWGAGVTESSKDEYAIPYDPHEDFAHIHDSILIFNERPKQVGSTAGHKLMDDHFYRLGRIEQVKNNTQRLMKALQEGDFQVWQEVVEQEALSLHGLMFASKEPVVLLEPETIRFIHDLRTFRKGKGLKVAFTIDAGPNIHLLYAKKHREVIQSFISNWILDQHLQIQVIDDETGKGAKQLF